MQKEYVSGAPKASFERRAQIALGTMAAFFAMNNPVHAEEPEKAPTVSVESLGDASLQKHVNGKEAIQERAKACKAAHDAAKEAKQSVDGRKEQIWLVIDTAVTKGASLKEHTDLLKSGLGELQTCFMGSGDHPRLAHMVRAEASGVTMYPIDGAALNAIAESAAKEIGTVELALNLEISKETSAEELKDYAGDAMNGDLTVRSFLKDAEDVTVGLSRIQTANGYDWELNGAIGVSRNGQTFSVQAGGGIDTKFSLKDGGHSGIGGNVELTRSEGVSDAAFSAHITTTLKENVSLVIGVKMNPDDHKIDFAPTVGIRMTRKVFE